MASCHWCKRPVSPAESKKMVTAHKQADGTTALNSPFEKITATGPLVYAAHFKCEKVAQSRARRSVDKDPVKGRGLGVAVSAYDVDKMVLNRDDIAKLEDAGLSVEEAIRRVRELTAGADAQWDEIRDRGDAITRRRQEDPGHREGTTRVWPAGETVEVDIEDLPTPEPRQP